MGIGQCDFTENQYEFYKVAVLYELYDKNCTKTQYYLKKAKMKSTNHH